MSLDELRNLDLNNPGGWPVAVKAVVLVLLAAGVIAAAWYFKWQDQLETLESARAEEQDLRQELDTKQQRAANLEAYEDQLAEMRRTFGDMLRQLPSRAEVAELLVDVSQSGLAAGLEFELFRPQDPVKREFYSELPVAVRVRGGYHEFASFVSAVANLPRIVTLHGITISGLEDAAESDASTLTMNLTAKTYWYLDGNQEAQ